MARPRNVQRTVDVHFMCPEDEHARLEVHLYSPSEQRVPYAAKQKFIAERIREFFARKSLDLSAYADVPPGSMVVHGSPEAIRLLQLTLRGADVLT